MKNRRRHPHRRCRALVAAFALASTGCGTNLEIVEIDELSARKPPGIVVNKTARYRIQNVTVAQGVGLDVTADDAQFPAVDQFKVLSLNVKRQPFADGKLSVKLNPAQQLSTVGITSEAGAARALGAAAAAAEAAAAVRARGDEAE